MYVLCVPFVLPVLMCHAYAVKWFTANLYLLYCPIYWTSLSDKSFSMALASGLALLEPIMLATNGDLTSSSSWSSPATPRKPAIKSAQTKCSSCSVGLSPSSSPRFAAFRSSRGTIGIPKKAWISLSQVKITFIFIRNAIKHCIKQVLF